MVNKEESIRKYANELIKVYSLYNSLGNKYLGPLETAAVKYCSGVFNKRGDLVSPKDSSVETSKLCREIVQIVNKKNSIIAKALIDNSKDLNDKPPTKHKNRANTHTRRKYIDSSFGKVSVGWCD